MLAVRSSPGLTEVAVDLEVPATVLLLIVGGFAYELRRMPRGGNR